MKRTLLASLFVPFLGLMVSACSTQSGPTYTAHAIVAQQGQTAPTYQVTCDGLFSSSQSCVKAAQKICADQPVTPVEYVDGIREGVPTKNPREMTFMCGKPATPAVAQPQSQIQPLPPVKADPQPQPMRQMLLQGDANFATGSAALSAAAKAGLDRFTSVNNGVTFQRVTVTGHTDSQGSRASNHELSEARANAVAQYLRSHGVDAQAFVVRGVGADAPVASNSTVEGRALNRRVEVQAVAR